MFLTRTDRYFFQEGCFWQPSPLGYKICFLTRIFLVLSRDYLVSINFFKNFLTSKINLNSREHLIVFFPRGSPCTILFFFLSTSPCKNVIFEFAQPLTNLKKMLLISNLDFETLFTEMQSCEQTIFHRLHAPVQIRINQARRMIASFSCYFFFRCVCENLVYYVRFCKIQSKFQIRSSFVSFAALLGCYVTIPQRCGGALRDIPKD